MSGASRGFWIVMCGVLGGTGAAVWRAGEHESGMQSSIERAGTWRMRSARAGEINRSDGKSVQQSGDGMRMVRQNRPSVWRVATSTERIAAHQLVTNQLNALQADNYPRALTLLTPDFAQSVGSLEVFRANTRTFYPQFANYRTVYFNTIHAVDDGLRLRVECVVSGRDGGEVRAVYFLKRDNMRAPLRIASIAARRYLPVEDEELPLIPALPERA